MRHGAGGALPSWSWRPAVARSIAARGGELVVGRIALPAAGNDGQTSDEHGRRAVALAEARAVADLDLARAAA